MLLHHIYILFFDMNKEPYLTILTILFGLILMSEIFDNLFLKYLIITLSFLSILSKKIAYLVHLSWFKLAKLLSFILPNLILSFIYFIILFPLAFLSKFFSSNDPLYLKKDYSSTFIDKKKLFPKTSFKKMW